MPAQAKALGFPCPECGREYGSIEVIMIEPKQSSNLRIIKDIRGNELKKVETKRRPILKPTEYAWKNRIESNLTYNKLVDAFTRVRNIDWSLITDTNQRQELSDRLSRTITDIESTLNEKRIISEQQTRDYAKWDIDSEFRVFPIHITDMKWNPIKIIKIYRQVGDPFAILNLPYEFFYKVRKKHGYAFGAEYISEEERKLMLKGLDVYAKYSESFYNRNWRYTWFEWFVIALYAREKGPRRAARMLRALDSTDKSLSYEYIRDRISPTLDFLKEYNENITGLFKFMNYIRAIVENDSELKQEYEIILRNLKKGRDDYENMIITQYNTKINQLHKLSGEVQIGNGESNVNTITEDHRGALPNGIILIGNERVKIRLTNKDYETERIRYEKLLQDANLKGVSRQEIYKIKKIEPKKRIICGPFHPSRLPFNVLEQLCKEGKIQT